MVLGPKKAIQHVPSKGRISIMKIQNFTVQKRQSVVTLVYGSLLIIVGMVSMIIDPITIVTNWYAEIKEGKFIYNMWSNPTYEVFSDVYIFNYTNVKEFLRGEDKVLKVQELGPYKFQEMRTNENITIDKERGVMTMNPVIKLKFLPDQSVRHYNDTVVVPNIALLAISTLLADQGLGYLANAAAYYTIKALDSELFKEMTAGEFLWGYEDPLVKVASSLVPGWIDFGKIGIMDRFYAQRREEVEVELRDPKTRYSINTWNKLPGLPEQGFKTLNTSIPCNRLKGTFEGLMLPPNYNTSNPIPVFRKQACRVHPFAFQRSFVGDLGFSVTRFQMEESAFNKTNRYACDCTDHCLPDGFVDIGSCYYGFPIALSKPHFLDTDPQQQAFFEGMHPDPVRHASHVDIETRLGVPMALETNIQVNIAVRSAAGNPVAAPLARRVLPLIWLSLYCKGPPPEVASILRLRFVIAPPLLLTLEILSIISGIALITHSVLRMWRPKYKLVQQEDKPMKVVERRKTSLVLNMADTFSDDELAKEAVSLLAIREEDMDLPDLLMNES
ncbi:scavenger receptor class B member 1-like [Colias croceus]|uniref:scavenger receptor class B member 1-like n=1 Tax=Colias crocea TaxID=72248 RepID=UPI001E27BEB3|nr:scavenger receptor class B member 1-like [Colias croceus]